MSPCHPLMNGQSESFYGTLINMLGILTEKNKSQLKDYISTLVHAYNGMKNNAMEFSPYFLMYGRKPNLPTDLYFGIWTVDLCATASTKLIQQLRDRLKWYYQVVQQVNEHE